MFIHPETATVFGSHSEIRAGFPNVAFEATIDASALEFLGIVEVRRDPRPVLAAGEVADALPPELDGDAWVSRWSVRQATPEEAAADRARVAALAKQIDEAAVAVFAKPTTLARVYERREAEAKKFADAGFTGQPGPYVKNFADPAGMPYPDAAKLVLQQAAMLRQAEEQLEALRMRKNELTRAANAEEAEAIAGEVLAGIAQIAALIG